MEIPKNWILNSKTGKYNVRRAVSREELMPFVQDGKLTILFGKILGNFDCSELGLVTLEGCPHTVRGSFDCSGNYLTNLLGAPQIVTRRFYCSKNPLESLKGASKNIQEYFWNGYWYGSVDKFKQSFDQIQIVKKTQKLFEMGIPNK